jgi:ABC-type glycerol-3-phosphate transport system substrate-binding protein
MKQLELSVLAPAPFLPDLLEQFHSPCSVTEMPWANAWEDLSQIASYRSGPDVSEIGTTWLDSLVDADAVRPFSSQEVDTLGGGSAFVPALWQTTSPHATLNRRVWAIPWLADVRLIFYWRDMLEQAGIDKVTAFQTPERVEETMDRLQASDVETPWGMWTDISYISLHNVHLDMASWG